MKCCYSPQQIKVWRGGRIIVAFCIQASQREISLLYLSHLKTRLRIQDTWRGHWTRSTAVMVVIWWWVVDPHVLDWNIIRPSSSARAVASQFPIIQWGAWEGWHHMTLHHKDRLVQPSFTDLVTSFTNKLNFLLITLLTASSFFPSFFKSCCVCFR